MPGHRRSLSEGLVLEDNDKGGVLVSGINSDLMDSQGLHKGDELIGATIHFDSLKRNDVIEILKLIEPYNDKVEVLTRQGMRSTKSLEHLDYRIKAPDEILKDSYNRMFNAKVKKFIKEDAHGGGQEIKTSSTNGQLIDQGLSYVNSKTDISNQPLNILPSVDSNDKKMDVAACLHKMERRQISSKTSWSVDNQQCLDVPAFGLHTDFPDTNDTSFPSDEHNFGLSGNLPVGPDFKDSTLTGRINAPGFKAPDIAINRPKYDLKGSKTGLGIPDMQKMPSIDLSGNLSKGLSLKGPKVKGEIDSPDIDLTLSKPDLEGPHLNMKSPDINIDGTGNLKIPKIKTPKFSHLDFKGPNIDVKGDLKGPDLNLSSPTFDADVNVPNIDIDGPNAHLKGVTVPDVSLSSGTPKMPKFKMPDFGFSGPKVKAPEGDLSLPKMKGELHSPNLTGPQLNVDVPTGDFKGPTLKGPKLDIKAPEFDIDAPDGKFKMPKWPDLKVPKIKGGLDSPDMNLSFPKADLKGPNVDLKSPNTDISGPSGTLKMPKLKTPKFSIPGLKEPDIDVKGDLKGPDLNLSSPTFDADVNVPKIDIDGPNAHLKGVTVPDVSLSSGKPKMPKFKMPDFGFSGPKVKAPEGDLSLPKMKGELHSPNLTGPQLNVDVPTGDFKGPKLDMKAPEFDIDAPDGKFKMPKWTDLKVPKIKGGLDSPDMNLSFPEANLKGPNLDLKSPDIDIDGPSGKLNMPKLKTPKFSIPGLKGPNIDVKGDLKGPDLNLSSPTFDADVNVPNIDIDGPNAHLKGVTVPDVSLSSGKPKMPKFKMPDFGFSGPKVKAPEGDLSLPKMKGELHSPNLTGPGINLDVPTGNIKVPTLKGPNLDMKESEFDIDAPDGKLKLPKFPDLKVPKIQGGLDSPDMSLSFNKADLKGPNVDLESPDIDINGPSGKLKTPKLKTPKFSIPGLKGPNIDVKGDLKGPDLNLSSPTLDVPNIDIDGPKGDVKGLTLRDMNLPSGKSKMPKFKMPGFGLSGPKVKAPEGDLSLPKMKGELHSPNLTRPQLNVDGPTLKGPKLDIKAPEFDIDAPDGKLKMPKWPDLKVPKIKGGLDSPDMNLSSPKGPSLDLKSVDLNIDGPSGKLNMPKLKTPKFSIPGLKGPNIDVKGDLKGPDLNLSSPTFDADVNVPNIDIDAPNAHLKGVTVPDVSLSSGKPKMPKFKMPDFGFSGPKVKAPEGDLSLPKMKGELHSPNLTGPQFNVDVPTGDFKGPTLKGPKLDMKRPDFDIDAPDGKLKMPKWPDLKVPKIKGGLDSPDMNLSFPKADLKGPNLDLKSPDIDIDGPSGKLNMPKLKTPKFSIPGLKGPDIDVKGDLKGPDLNLSSPTFDADVNVPNIDIDGPNAHLKGVTVPDVSLSSGKPKMPKFKMPDFGFSGPKVKTPEGDLSLPKMKGELHSPNLTGPQLNVDVPTGDFKGPKLDIKAPDFDIDAPDGKLKMPKWPDLKVPKIKGGLDSPDMNLSFPKANLKGPNVDLKPPDTDIDGPSGKLKMPKLKTPKFSLPGFKGPDIDTKGDLKGPDVSLSSPKFGVPDLEIDGPRADVNGMSLPDIKMPSGKSKKPQFKMPDVGFSGPKMKAPEGDLSLPRMKGEMHSPNLTGPHLNLDVPTGNIQVSTLKEPNLDIRSTEFDFDGPSGKLKMPKGPDLKAPKIKGGIDSPDMSMSLPEASLNMPKLNVKSPDVDVPTGKLKMPKLKTPKVSLPGFKGPDNDFKGDFASPDVTFSSPKMDATLPDMSLSSGKVNKPRLKMPNIGLSGPKLKVPEIDLSLPQMKGEIQSPNIQGLDANIDIPTGRKNAPGLSSMDLNFPKPDLGTPKMNVQSPDIGIESSNKLMPTFTIPNLEVSKSKFKTPETGVSTSIRNVDSPDFNIRGYKTNLEDSGFNAEIPAGRNKVLQPDINVHKASGFESGAFSGKVKMPNFSSTLSKDPYIRGGIDSSDMNLHFPEVDMSVPNPDVESELRSASLNMSNSGLNKRHDMDNLWHKNTSNGSVKIMKDLESFGSGFELEVPKQSLKGSKFKLLSLV